MNLYFSDIKKNFGFGCMRLPMLDGEVDQTQMCAIVDTFLENGFNYFDTAHGYLGGKSETALRDFLTSRYSRDKYILTDKLTNFFFKKQEDIRPFFEGQLEACGVDYFDFYLMHAQNAENFAFFKQCRAYETALELKAEGKFRHFGISFHDTADVLEQILTEYPQIEVVQIQLNYVDYDDPAVQSRKCYEICRKYGKPVIVMEPVMNSLTESIKTQGIISPLIVRPIENTDEYEVVSGHRRLHAAVKAGLSEVPALIYPLDRNEAVIAVVDSNLHRERILPSEKAFAYKMKMEAMKAQGKRTDLTLSQVATKSDTAAEIGKEQGESRDKVFRYIRLTHLIPELLQKVDEGVIALSPAVELSYLSEEQQKILLDAMCLNECTPSHAQSIRMKKAAQQGTLSSESIYEIMLEEKANQTERISFKVQDLKAFFSFYYTQKQMSDTILKLLYDYNKKLERRRNSRDER